MQLTVKTLKGSRFQIRVNPTDTIMAVKKKIEEVQGKDSYPCGQQLLIHSGKVLKDEKTLEESNVGEDGFLVVMLSKSKTSGAGGTSSAQPSTTATIHPTTTVTTTTAEAPPQAPTSPNLESQSERATTEVPGDSYGQAASNIVADTNREQIINQLMDMGGGNWDRDTVMRALRAAYNNPERAVEYLYSGIPEAIEVAVPAARLPSSQMSVLGANSSDATIHESPSLSGLPNSAPLNMFPQGTPGAGAGGGSLGFLRQNQQFQALRTMVQSNPQILQPMLQELSKQNPQLLRLIQEHHAEFLQLINEPVEDVEGAEGDLFDQPEEMPHAINVTPDEQLAIERLEAMGFDRARVVEAFLACDRNEELAANYLLENVDDEE